MFEQNVLICLKFRHLRCRFVLRLTRLFGQLALSFTIRVGYILIDTIRLNIGCLIQRIHQHEGNLEQRPPQEDQNENKGTNSECHLTKLVKL